LTRTHLIPFSLTARALKSWRRRRRSLTAMSMRATRKVVRRSWRLRLWGQRWWRERRWLVERMAQRQRWLMEV